MNESSIKIATRGSPLALWQARWAQSLLQKSLSTSVEIEPYKTTGDLMQNTGLNPFPRDPMMPHWSTGKGVFVKEIQEALLQHKAQIAVHSMKDVPVVQTPGLEIVCLLPRAHPSDVMILSPKVLASLKELQNIPTFDLTTALHKILREGDYTIGTSSARRRAYSHQFFNGIPCVEVRGNVESRLKKVNSGELGATFLAKAGLDRLQLFQDENMVVLNAMDWVPSSCQGIVALEVSSSLEKKIYENIATHTHGPTAIEALLERTVLEAMGGDCQTPIGIFAGNQQKLVCTYQSQKGLVRWEWTIPAKLYEQLLPHTAKGWAYLKTYWNGTEWASDLYEKLMVFKSEVECH